MKPLVIPGREPSKNALPVRALCFAAASVMSDVMSENVAKLIGPYWLHLAGLDITRRMSTAAEMAIYLD
jgi:hypothetical protein